MRIKHVYKNVNEFMQEDFEDLQRVYDYIDEGPSWNRCFEVYKRVIRIGFDKPIRMTYVVEYGAPNYWGHREIVSVTGYKHYED